jgi:DDE superfamily endonuclease
MVCDHLNTHTKGAFYETFEPERARQLVRRILFCYTPKYGSWLNIAENELSSLTRHWLSGKRFGDILTLACRLVNRCEPNSARGGLVNESR